MSGDSDYKSILSRSGHAVAHDEERRAFERLGKRAGQKAQVAKFGEPVALGVCRFRERVGNVAAEPDKCDLRVIARFLVIRVHASGDASITQ